MVTQDSRPQSLPYHGNEVPRRAAIACANCAMSKTKCDRRHPCGRCRSKGITCISRPSRRGKMTRSNAIVAVDTIIDNRSTVPSVASEKALETSLDSFGCHLATTEPQLHQQTTAVSALLQDSDLSNGWILAPSYPSLNGSSSDHDIQNGSQDAPNMDLDNWQRNCLDPGWLPSELLLLEGNNSQTSPCGAPWPLLDATFARENALLGSFLSKGFPFDEDDQERGPWLLNLEHWSVCRCNPPPKHAPADTGKSSIAAIDRNFGRPGSWSDIQADWRAKNFEPAEYFTNVVLSDSTREWMLMAAQRFMRIAVDVHGLTLDELGPLGGYVRLPPTKALHNYIEIALWNCEPFYPLIPARIVDPSALTSNQDGGASSLMLFPMLALGSMIDPATKARRFSTALTEICRHSIVDMLEKDLGSPEITRCGLMFIVKSAFSGDKAHMNIATAQRHVYLTFMRSAGMFKAQPTPDQLAAACLPGEIEQKWLEWIEWQNTSRLVYGWVILEHEISLFYNYQPAISLSELEIALPADDSLWLAASAEEWYEAMCKNGFGDGGNVAFDRQTEPSLCTLFQSLMDGQLDRSDYQPQLIHMRLLLYPIHTLVSDLGQLLSYSPIIDQPWQLSEPITQASSTLCLKEIQNLLERWLDHFQQLTMRGARARAMRTATMVLYHITNLNLLTSFDKIESLARKDCGFENQQSAIRSWLRGPEHVLMHCGQLFRLYSEIENELRPVWSAYAIYRATMTLWALSIWDPRAQGNAISISEDNPRLTINVLEMDASPIQLYLRSGQASPQLSTKSGKLISLSDPEAILSFGIEELCYGPLTTPLCLGVRAKLGAMSEAWKGEHQLLREQRSL